MVEILPEDAPAPRLCHLIKWPDFDGYGFNLHAERSNPGQFIGKIDEQSPAEMAGLREGDRIIEVNGVNIANENHRQVVERIKSNPDEAKLLVVDQAADVWYREQDLVVKSSQINVVYIKTPVPRPRPDSPPLSSPSQADQGQTSATTSAPEQTSASEAPKESNGGGSGKNNSQNSNQKPAQDNEQTQDERELESPDGRVSPPMSPDSGRGGDEADRSRDSPAPTGKPADSLTIQAEINRSRPQPVEESKVSPSESTAKTALDNKVSLGIANEPVGEIRLLDRV